jgi:hypothetical protein
MIHLIWLGPDTKRLAKNAVKHWERMGSGQNVALHIDDSLLLPEFRAAWELCTNFSMKSDLLRWSILLTQGGWYFDCDIKTRKTLEDIEKDCRLNRSTCLATMFGTIRSEIITDTFNCYPEWPGRQTIIDYVKNKRGQLSNWAFAIDMIGPIFREHPEWFNIAPLEQYSNRAKECVFTRPGQRAGNGVKSSSGCGGCGGPRPAPAPTDNPRDTILLPSPG